MKRIFRFQILILLAFIICGIKFDTKAASAALFPTADLSPVYDHDYYINRYPDLYAVYSADPAGAYDHFLKCGMAEGRQASPSFNVYAYMNRYPDLREAFKDDLKAYYYHYVSFGISEGRSASGDEAAPSQTPSDEGADTPKGPLSGMTVILDAGHGGRDPGCIRNGVYEKNVNLSIVMKTGAMLESFGAEVLFTRPGDSFVSLEYRYAFENLHPNAVFVSIHCNALPGNASHSGMNAYCFAPGNEKSSLFAACVYSGALYTTGATAKGLKTDSDYKVVLYSTIPSVLLETGYMSSPKEFRLLTSSGYQDLIAAGITTGLINYRLCTSDSTVSAEESGR